MYKIEAIKPPNQRHNYIYSALDSSLVDGRTGETVVESSWKSKHPSHEMLHLTHADNPSPKSSRINLLKIQLGFGCNMGCSYCSQANQRAQTDRSWKESELRAQTLFSLIDKTLQLSDHTQIEFWGGETLIYWDRLEILARLIRQKYPKSPFVLFTNGTLIKSHMIDAAKELRIHFVISHDGAASQDSRGRDPLLEGDKLKMIKQTFQALSPLNLISFNATLTNKNHSVRAIRDYIASKLGVDPLSVVLSHDVALAYDDNGLQYIVSPEEEHQVTFNLFKEFVELGPIGLTLGQHHLRVQKFLDDLIYQRPIESTGQKCRMDLPSSLAIDIDGNILTCQNVTVDGGHKIGHLSQLDQARLHTATHFLHRESCKRCPMAQICQGSCMFLQGHYFEASCNQMFIWSKAYFAYVLYALTGYIPTKVIGPNIRNRGIDEEIIIDEGLIKSYLS